jgi:hypothetical protein
VASGTRSINDILSRIASALFVVALFALVIFFGLKLIPSAERPTLSDRPGTSAVSPSR